MVKSMIDHSPQSTSQSPSSQQPTGAGVWRGPAESGGVLGATANTAELKRRYLVRRFWETARRYWTEPRSRRTAWALTAALLGLILLDVGATYAMNRWNRSIFDALENKNSEAVFALSLIYFVILAVSV